jgi:hypothetical protein
MKIINILNTLILIFFISSCGVDSGNAPSFANSRGVLWSSANLSETGSWRGMTYGNGRFVAVSYGGSKSQVSTNGLNWSSGNMPSSAN